LAISAAAGWRANNLTLGVGQATVVGHDTPYSIRLDSFDSTGAGEVTLLGEADQIGTGRLAFGQPTHLAGLTIFVSGKGPAIHASATLNGRPAHAPSHIGDVGARAGTVTNSSRAMSPIATLPCQTASWWSRCRAMAASRRDRRPRCTGAGRAPLSQALAFDLTAKLNIDNAALTFGTQNYAVLDVVRDPGKLITQGGMVMLALGLALAVIWPTKRLVASAVRRNSGDWRC